jgi:hypothetical protein
MPSETSLSGSPESLCSLLLEVKVLQESERAQVFGEALPTGLRLVTEA